MVGFSSLAKGFGYGAVVALALGYFNVVKPFRFAARYTVFVLLVIVSALYGVGVSIVMTIIGKQGASQHFTGRLFYYLMRILLGIDVHIKNESILHKTRPAVFVSNHQSELDLLLLARTFPKWCSVTAKKSLKYYPFLGWFMILSGTAFLDRARRDKALAAIDEAQTILKQKNQSVFMFPEGHRSKYEEPGLLPFKKGAFHFAVQAQVPIVPFVVQNYSTIWSWRRKILDEGVIEVQVLDPVQTVGLSSEDVNGLVEKVRSEMLSTAKDLGHTKSTA